LLEHVGEQAQLAAGARHLAGEPGLRQGGLLHGDGHELGRRGVERVGGRAQPAGALGGAQRGERPGGPRRRGEHPVELLGGGVGDGHCCPFLRAAGWVRASTSQDNGSRPRTTGLDRVPTCAISMSTRSPSVSEKLRSGTIPVPVNRIAPSGKSLGAYSTSTSSSSVRCRRAVLVSPSNTTAPSRTTFMVIARSDGSTSHAGRIPVAMAQEPLKIFACGM